MTVAVTGMRGVTCSVCEGLAAAVRSTVHIFEIIVLHLHTALCVRARQRQLWQQRIVHIGWIKFFCCRTDAVATSFRRVRAPATEATEFQSQHFLTLTGSSAIGRQCDVFARHSYRPSPRHTEKSAQRRRKHSQKNRPTADRPPSRGRGTAKI